MRRRDQTAPMSLFSFQDIITSVTGIIITVTLVLALELVQSLAERQSTETPAVARQVRTALEEARQQVEALRSQVRNEGDRVARWAALSPHQLERETFDIVVTA